MAMIRSLFPGLVAMAAVASGGAMARDCLMATGSNRCQRPPVAAAPDAAAPVERAGPAAGDPVPADARMILDPGYHGLPPVRDGWRYYRHGGQVWRVDPSSGMILGPADDADLR